ncbi:T9SS type A sorting domain-containing protein [Crocinitomicaceae bacterium]|nr:T9SS type A sorting domain-containing protein [Crocinitomicaceae bacterium]
MKKQLTFLMLLTLGTATAQTFTNYTTSDGLINNNVLCLDVSSSDVLWFGTQDGISVFDGANWTSHTNSSDPGLIDNNIQAIRVMSNGDVWAGTDFGACHYDGSAWTTYTTADGLGNNQIKCIEEDASGNVWFGTNSGASYYDGNSWVNVGTSDGLPFGGVTAINIDGNGDVWLGSGLGGIAIYNGSIGSMITEASTGLVDDRMRGIRNDANGNRWIGTSEGISVLDGSNNNIGYHTQIYTLPAPDTLNPIEDVEIDNSGNIWVGVYVDYLVTEGGVCAFDGNSWTEYHVADGLVGPVVRALTIDSENSVWVATSSGISKISDHAVLLNELNSETFEMHPNPASENVIISFPENVKEEIIYVFSASMQLIEMLVFNSGSQKITYNISHLSSGVYFVRSNGTMKKLFID